MLLLLLACTPKTPPRAAPPEGPNRPDPDTVPADVRALVDPRPVIATPEALAAMRTALAGRLEAVPTDCSEPEDICRARRTRAHLAGLAEQQALAPAAGIPCVLMIADHPALDWETLLTAVSLERAETERPAPMPWAANPAFMADIAHIDAGAHALCTRRNFSHVRRLELAATLLRFPLLFPEHPELPSHTAGDRADPWPFLSPETRAACRKHRIGG